MIIDWRTCWTNKLIFLLLEIQDTENGKLKCDISNGFSGIPWLTEFSLVNESDPFKETENMMSGGQLSCNYTEFQRFDSFFSKFITVAREFFLPPEKHRFGLVSERSLLQYLGIGDSDSWFATLYLAGCPSCSKIFKEENDLKSILQMNNEIVAEVTHIFCTSCFLLLCPVWSFLEPQVLYDYNLLRCTTW